MKVSETFAKAFRGGGQLLDLPVAALAGIAVAFAAVAAPAEAIEALVQRSGLASIVAAAEPPLGFKARLGLAGAGALLAFLLVFALLRRLDGRGRAAEAAAADEEPGETPPRLRRRDFHPDAPPRPPLLAGRDFGEPDAPLELATEAETEAEAEDRIVPDWLEPAEPAAEPEAAPAEEPARPRPAPPVEAARSAPEPPPPVHGQSIAELMERLERGLARRGAAPAPAAAPDEAAIVPAADDRLQSAIDSLQRLAARQS